MSINATTLQLQAQSAVFSHHKKGRLRMPLKNFNSQHIAVSSLKTKCMDAEFLRMQSPHDLLRLHNDIEQVLRGGEDPILRTKNPPAGDYAEWLFAKTFGFKREKNSTKSSDVIELSGNNRIVYQVKGRRPGAKNNRQLSAIRSTDFDHLVCILMNDDYTVRRACKMSKEIFLAKIEGKVRNEHVNANIFYMQDYHWDTPGVECITAALKASENMWHK